jgi:hypothetical protein
MEVLKSLESSDNPQAALRQPITLIKLAAELLASSGNMHRVADHVHINFKQTGFEVTYMQKKCDKAGRKKKQRRADDQENTNN